MRYDVIIVGSGPAGASTALHLARLNPALARRTLVLERDRHPRHKLCGGGCVPDVDICLANLGLDSRQVPSVEVDWAHLNYARRGSPVRFSNGNTFRVVRRADFDHWLADQVRQRGVELQEETRVLRLRRVEGGVEVETDRGSYTARVVVGADGSGSVVRRLAAADSHATAVARVVEIVTPDAPRGTPSELSADGAYFDFACTAEGIQGYAWSFPMFFEGKRARNWGVYDSCLPRGKTGGSLRPILARWLSAHGYRLDDYRLDGHPIRLFDARGEFAAPHVLLVGDAAGVDAVFGEGISLALGYGELAAEAIRDAFASGDYSFHDYRKRVLRSRLGRALKRRTRTARALNRLSYPPLQKLIWRRLGSAVRWYLEHFVFHWARPTATAPVSVGSPPRWHVRSSAAARHPTETVQREP